MPQPYENNNENNNDLSNYTSSSENMAYYKKMIPNFDESSYYKQAAISRPYGSNIDSVPSLGMNSGNDILLQKLNYMIHLLEESKDEKTNNVTEEVILYSFLGIFIIFIVDSFVKVGKYVR